MKNPFKIFVSLCLSVVICVLFLTSCGHRHEFGEWTVTKEKTCTDDGERTRSCACGETETETIAKGHTPREATCERAQICTVCKAELAPAKGHDFGEPVVTPPTCTIRGTTAAKCKFCNKKQVTDSIPPLGHTPGAAATCTTHQICTVCNAELEHAKGHKYTVTVVDPTCTGDMGYTVWSCNECGYTYNDNYKESKGHQIYVPTVIKEEIDLNYSVINDSSYPFRTQNGILVSTNHSDDTVSTYTIIALKDFFFEAECRASSETNDHLIIKLNDEILFSKGGELEWLEANIEMKAGDTLTFIYNKDGAQCEGSDCIYLALFAYNWQYVTATEEMLAEYMTCFEDLKCEHCGEVLKERTGHIYVDTVTPPTATEKGYTTHTCACGDSYTDTYNATKDLQKRFSEYYNLDTFKGIEVYVWQTNDGTYECGAMNGTNRNKTFEEILLLEKNGATFEEMRTILSSYNIDKERIVIIPVNINAEDFEIEIGEFAQISEMFWDN